ncbi:MAG: DNA translocase FtsK [Oscillospiraceae bacterium]
MAQTARSSSARRSSPAKKPASRAGNASRTRKPTVKEQRAAQQARKQMWAVVLFALGLLFLALTLIKGNKIWLGAHNGIFGLLGWSAYFIAPLIIYIAVIAALDRPLSSIKAKLWQAGILVLLISAAIEIFGGLPEAEGFISILKALYLKGVDKKGGGVFGLLLAGPLTMLADSPVPQIIISLLIFVFLMWVTGSSLISLFKMITKPVRQIEDVYTAKVEEISLKPKKEQPLQEAAPPRLTRKQRRDAEKAAALPIEEIAATPVRFGIDVDISGDSDPGAFAQTAAEAPADPLRVAVEESGFQPPETLPGHPVTTQIKAPEAEPVLDTPIRPEPEFGVDTPVEYISVQPRVVEFPDRPAPLRAHPLEEDIRRAEEEDTAQVIQRFLDEVRTGESVSYNTYSGLEETPLALLEDDLEIPPPAFDPDILLDVVRPVPSIPVLSVHTRPLDDDEVRRSFQNIRPIDPERIPYTPPEAAERYRAVANADQQLEIPLPPGYNYPPVSLLKQAKAPKDDNISAELRENAEKLISTLASFGVKATVTDVCRGPAVTRYELQPSAGVKISKITGLADDIALNLAAAGIRIEAPIPGKAAIGIEVPNRVVSTVSMKEIIDSEKFRTATSSLSVALGKDITGGITVADLAKMPHMLIAGATGSGKSVCINSLIVSLLYKSSPDEVKLLLVDPKVVELGIYNGIPHLLVPVVTDPKKAAGALAWAVSEMLNRYKTFAEHSVRDITGYNKLAATKDELEHMPKIVIIIDELADLMMAAPGEVEDSICRLAQMARAAGMHLVIATQRPSVDVITGVIKANIPSRVAFAVSSQVDSRTILDSGGAEKLLGRGDMLFYPVGSSKPTRIQGCFVSDSEVEQVVEYVKQREETEYDQNIVEEIDRHAPQDKKGRGGNADSDGGGFDEEDEMLPYAIDCVVEAGQASTSLLQRRLKLGYARAARIIDQLEEKGIVGPFEGSKPRQVLISKERLMEMKLMNAD